MVNDFRVTKRAGIKSPDLSSSFSLGDMGFSLGVFSRGLCHVTSSLLSSSQSKGGEK